MSKHTKEQRSIKDTHRAQRADMPGLKTVRAIPTPTVEQIDPFIFLNHHGPDHFPPNNTGLPFEPHPHRGMQTVTFIVDGDILHRDNAGHDESVIGSGGVQWMVAGEGLLHSETSSDDFRRTGGEVEILQLWINLPKDKKWVKPAYRGLQNDEIPVSESDEGKVRVKVITGSHGDTEAAYEPLTDVEFYWIDFDAQGIFETAVAPSRNIFCYVVRGQVTVNGNKVKEMHLVEFDDDGDSIAITADKSSLVLFGHATPYNEPVVAGGPFVMNTQAEIRQAYEDLRSGGFGKWTMR